MLNRKFIAKAFVGSLTLASLALAGCGASPAAVEDPYLEDPSYTDPYAPGTDPNAGGQYGGGTTTPGYGTEPGYGTTPGLGMGGELSASVIKVKNGSFMGIGKCKVTVEVMNPSQQQLSGTLTVTFTNGGKPTKNVISQQVTLAGGESSTSDFEDKKWSTDNATAEITTDTPVASQPAYGGGTTGGYGQQPAYGGGTTGGYPTY
jgi:hypothetical protein